MVTVPWAISKAGLGLSIILLIIFGIILSYTASYVKNIEKFLKEF